MSIKKNTNSTNVLGEPLVACCFSPKTGYFRDGFCRTDASDIGLHTVCAQMTNNFLEFSKNRGNDLITPKPAFDFPGLKAGDRWCLCVLRWQEAWENNAAPPLILESCHHSVLEHISIEVLKQHAVNAHQ